jgi:pimeloyl-ACP methyl ester carboxylesterase
MKLFIITCIALLTLSNSYAQNTSSDLSSKKFISYFNSGKADSISILLSDDAKKSITPDKISGAITQLKAALGNLTKSEFFQGDENTITYLATFEKSGPVLYLNFNKTNKIIGFFVNIDKREKDLPGTVTLKTNTAVLKGTLSMPNTTQQIPVVLLIAGSGPTDRNGNSMLSGGKPNYLLQISDALTLKNIAVLRYDKRGIGQSTTTKTEAELTFNDIVEDASAFIKFLKADKRFSKVIVMGHSEGSLVGMLACEKENVDAFVSISGAAFPADVILKTQIKETASPEIYKKAVLIIDSIKAGKKVIQKLDRDFKSIFHPSVQPYLYSWMQYNPSIEISKLTLPTLIVQGTNDVQVGVLNAEELKKSNPNAQLKLIKGMNHVLKEAPADRTQNIATYTAADLPLDMELIPVLSQFISNLK